jgi:hypothetical protein
MDGKRLRLQLRPEMILSGGSDTAGVRWIMVGFGSGTGCCPNDRCAQRPKAGTGRRCDFLQPLDGRLLLRLRYRQRDDLVQARRAPEGRDLARGALTAGCDRRLVRYQRTPGQIPALVHSDLRRRVEVEAERVHRGQERRHCPTGVAALPGAAHARRHDRGREQPCPDALQSNARSRRDPYGREVRSGIHGSRIEARRSAQIHQAFTGEGRSRRCPLRICE